jgi:hypothetical protein
MVDNGTAQALAAEALTMTPGAEQGPEVSGSAAGAENSNVVVREVSGKLESLIGV